MIVLRHILSAVLQKPVRLLLILLALGLSSAAIFASVSLSGSMMKTTTNQWRGEYGWSDLVVTPTLASPSQWFSAWKADRLAESFKFAVGRLSTRTVAVIRSQNDMPAKSDSIGDLGPVTQEEHIGVSLYGYPLEETLRMLHMPFIESDGLFPFAGNKIIVSDCFAARFGIVSGVPIAVDINGNRHLFTVCAIASRNGPFASDGRTFSMMVPLEKLQACLGGPGKVDALYVGLKDKRETSRVMRALSGLYKGFSVREAYSVEHIRLQNNRTAVPFVFMSVLLSLMSIYVIRVVFRNILSERMPLMGTFRAMGAMQAATERIILLECACYGLLGGLIGLGGGTVLLSAMIRHLRGVDSPGDVMLDITPWQIMLAVSISIAISLVGGWISLPPYRKISVIGLIHGESIATTHGNRSAALAAIPLMASSAAALAFWRSSEGLPVRIMLAVAFPCAFMLASTYLFSGYAEWIARILAFRRSGAHLLGLSVRRQRSFTTACTIIAILTSTSFAIDTISRSNEEGINRHYRRFRYDIELKANDLTKGRLNYIAQLPGVAGAYGNYRSGSVNVKGQPLSIYSVNGLDPQTAGECMDYSVRSTYPDPFAALAGEKAILITETLADLYGVREGDEIVLEVFGFDGVYREVPFRIIGLFEDNHTKLGRYVLMSFDSFKDAFRAGNYTTLSIRADNTDVALQSVEQAYRGRQSLLTTVGEMESAELEEGRLVILAMRWISRMSVLTGILGMLFVAMLALRERAGELSAYRAMGLSGGGLKRILVAEGLLEGFGGALAGLALGFVLCFAALPRIIHSLQIALTLQVQPCIPFLDGLASIATGLAVGLAGAWMTHGKPILEGLRDE